MCDIMEELMEKRSRNDRIECAKRIIALGKHSPEEIAKALNLPLSTIQELISSELGFKTE